MSAKNTLIALPRVCVIFLAKHSFIARWINQMVIDNCLTNGQKVKFILALNPILKVDQEIIPTELFRKKMLASRNEDTFNNGLLKDWEDHSDTIGQPFLDATGAIRALVTSVNMPPSYRRYIMTRWYVICACIWHLRKHFGHLSLKNTS